MKELTLLAAKKITKNATQGDLIFLLEKAEAAITKKRMSKRMKIAHGKLATFVIAELDLRFPNSA
jgi:hypothetical protein